ncbi:translation elongation factor Ts [Buchnera aphidicola (Mollitrichosiphum nigrofasciatum)]|uniref:translation elongation factor Ts n=1 Tax=Buchnera aphidicola TaxID=9 RepID=UPI0031B85ADB
MHLDVNLIKKLRDITGLGVIECKNALITNNNDIELSVDYLRKSGNLKIEQKSSKSINQGSVFASVKNKMGGILELNCETDFVARNEIFKKFGEKIINFILLEENGNIEFINKIFDQERKNLVLRFGENIIIKKTFFLKSENLISFYLHGFKIAVLVDGIANSSCLIKKIAMHIAACSPKYLNEKDIPEYILKREYNVQMEIALNTKKSLEISKKIVQGRMQKFINDNTLLGQEFIFEKNVNVGDFLKKNNISILSFVRFSI